MTKIQINITSINNGFLVSTPPTKIVEARSQEEFNALNQAVVMFCEDYDAVCSYIGGIMVTPTIVTR